MRTPHSVLSPDVWLAGSRRFLRLNQPGQRTWLYMTPAQTSWVCSSRGPRVARSRAFLAERGLRAARHGRYRLLGAVRQARAAGRLLHARSGRRAFIPSSLPIAAGRRNQSFSLGSRRPRTSTADDWHAFGRMLLTGWTVDGRRILSEESSPADDDELPDRRPSAPHSTLFLRRTGLGLRRLVSTSTADRPLERAACSVRVGSAEQVLPRTSFRQQPHDRDSGRRECRCRALRRRP